jgi:hypothetical protein
MLGPLLPAYIEFEWGSAALEYAGVWGDVMCDVSATATSESVSNDRERDSGVAYCHFLSLVLYPFSRTKPQYGHSGEFSNMVGLG